MGNDGEFMSWLHMVEIYNYVYQPCFSLISLILSVSIYMYLSLSLVFSYFSFFTLIYSHFPIRRASLVSHPDIHFRQSYRRPLPRTILYDCYLRLLLLRGDGYRYCMAAAHRETILTGKKTGGTLRYESCNLSRFFSRSNLQFDQITSLGIYSTEAFNCLSIVYLLIVGFLINYVYTELTVSV